MEKEGFVFSGTSPDGRLVEIIELKTTLGSWRQFHPELVSRPNRPQPLFHDFVRASITNKETSNKKRLK